MVPRKIVIRHSFKPCLISFAYTAMPNMHSSSPTDWSDVTQFINDVDTISSDLQPVLKLGGELQSFLAEAQQQMGIPSQLHDRLIKLSDLTQFLYDFSQFLQLFPIFKSFLPPLTASLAGEKQTIANLDTNMSQLVQSTSQLSTSIKVCA